ncbi:MAG TPA: HD domain-containing protein [Steroidobacteraceae bacterium]|nr:HD domain-containing protein [Steroidobacteraceae bacterium]
MVIPTSSPPLTQPDDALAAASAVLAEAGSPPVVLERAREAGGIVFELTGDAPLATAALLHAARRTDRGAPELTAAQGTHIGTPAMRLAAQLDRLGDFQLDAQWSAGERLASGQAETLRKMLLAVVGDPRLVIARLAGQLVRARRARDQSPAERRQIALEIQELYAPLANRLGIWSLKWELEDLALRESQPADYQRIKAALNEKRRDRELYIKEVIRVLEAALRAAGIEAEVAGRPKHIFSIWRKMQRKRLAFEQILDLRAVRIIAGSVADCYAALGVVHELWPFLPSEFDDYIATPKGNNYQSIHTAVRGPDGRPLEVQIRTRQMHALAELGVAAHWRYKEGGVDRRYDDKIQQVRELLHGAPGGESADALTRLASGLFEDRVYALTPKGEVIDLPRGGTALDFAFHLHSGLGERCRGAKINGRIAPLNQQVKSGDVVEVITGKEPAPSRDWLAERDGYLVSPRSRAKLRAFFRRLDEAKETGGKPAAGNGKGATAAGSRSVAAPPPAAHAPRPATRSAKARKAGGGARSPVQIDGVGDLPITLARCCAPMRPQPIRGYLTLGRGVTIHQAGCPGLARMVKQKPQRLLEVDWSDAANSARIAARVLIEAFDRRGLLRDISDTIAEEHLSIEGVSSNTDPNDRIARFEVRVSVRDAGELSRLQRRLARIPNVYKVRRGV